MTFDASQCQGLLLSLLIFQPTQGIKCDCNGWDRLCKGEPQEDKEIKWKGSKLDKKMTWKGCERESASREEEHESQNSRDRIK